MVQAIIVIPETVKCKFHEKCQWTFTENVKLSVELQKTKKWPMPTIEMKNPNLQGGIEN